MNKHIELVKRWLADPKSVTVEELNVNADAAEWAAMDAAEWAVDAGWAAAAADAGRAAAAADAYAIKSAAGWAAMAADAAAKSAAADAAFWVRRYEELIDE